MRFSLQAVRVATGSGEEGLLALDEDHRLTAVLTRLTDQHDGVSERWFLEAGFGRLDGPDHSTFADLDASTGSDKAGPAGGRRPPSSGLVQLA